MTWNKWRNERPGKILLVLTCLKKGNEEKKKRRNLTREWGGSGKKKKKKKKKKGKKKEKKKKLMMQVQVVSNAGTGYMVASRLLTVSRWYSQNTVSATNGKRLFPTT